MIYIEKNEDTNLPEKYHKINNVCSVLYDQLGEIFRNDNYKTSDKFHVEFDKNTHTLIDELQRNEISPLDWLKANNLDYNFFVNSIAKSIIHDFLNFIYESLICAKKGKMSIAFSLLRKPFTDELLILEQLLYDPHDFIQRFYFEGNPENYKPDSKEINHKILITNALSSLQMKILFNEDLIHSLRYDKSCGYGINAIANMALHIVTSNKNYKTDNQSLNFVFSTKEEIEKYWEHYYYTVPYLLSYSVSIIDSIIFRSLSDEYNQTLKAIKSFKRFICQIVWLEEMANQKENSENLFNVLTCIFDINCPECNHKKVFTKADFELFLDQDIFICENCFNTINDSEKLLEVIKDVTEQNS